MKFTEKQQQAIDTRKSEVLVSAAAGSGKTAVLIERIIQLLLNDRVPITEIVVLTFTNAAAAQMKNRLRIRLTAIITDNSYSKNERAVAKEQLLYLPLAYISTFHAFCIRILRSNYEQIHLDPGFKIGDENEMALLKQEALDETLDFFFAEQNPDFLHAANSFVTTTNIKEFRSMILRIFERSRAFAHPEEWKKNVISWYGDEAKIVKLQESYQIYFIEKLEQYYQSYIFMQQLMQGFEKHTTVLFDLAQELGEIIDICHDDFAEGIQEFEKLVLPNWPRIATDNKTDDTDDAHERYKTTNKEIKLLQKDHYDLDDIAQKQRDNLPLAETVINIISEFEERFSKKKDQRSVLDFSDIEHQMIQLLETNEAVRKNISLLITEMLVDEYQDTNETQDTILYYLKHPENRIFMVGDVKQSIYRFRLADPTIFLEKQEAFSGHAQEVIFLNQNFRSTENVLAAINQICYELLRIDVEYTEENQLYYGNKQYDHALKHQTNWHFFNQDALANNILFQDADAKAKYIVHEIMRILNEEEIYDMKTNSMRAVQKSDIAILYRNRLTDLTIAIEQRLDEYGIAYSSSTDRGYFEAIEIRVILSLLQVLDNPYHSIELLSFMRSPIGGFTDTELATIRQHPLNENTSSQEFYDYIQNIIASKELGGTPLHQKLEKMEELLQRYRRLVTVQPISKVLTTILEETGYLSFVGTLPYGNIRMGNLRMLIEIAQKRTEYGVSSLRSFNRYMKNLQRHNKDFALAKEDVQTNDAIQMMTIHGSKGLEFPIVFLVDVDKQFNKMDSRSNFQITKDEGLAFRYTDVEERTREKTWHYDLMANMQIADDAGEEMRVLYVALTRAEQQLHIFLDEDQKQSVRRMETNEIIELKSFGDGLRYALRQIMQSEILESDTSLHIVKDIVLDETQPLLQSQTPQRIVEKTKKLSSETLEMIDTQVQYVYPKINLQNYPQKQTVSEMKRMHEMRDEHHGQQFLPQNDQQKQKLKSPKFIEEKHTVTAQEKGTLYHFILEHYDFETQKTIQQEIDTMYRDNVLLESEVEVLDVERLQHVVEDITINYLQKGYEVFGREIPFAMTVQASEVYQEDEVFGIEEVAIQGKIDLLLKKEDTFILIDFKTDKVKADNPEAFLLKRYETQIQLYKQAIKKNFNTKKVDVKIYPIMSKF